jgi:hypothetical protein
VSNGLVHWRVCLHDWLGVVYNMGGTGKAGLFKEVDAK